MALVLADRSAVVLQARDAAYPTLQTAQKRVLSGSGQREGYAAGQRADLGGPRLAGQTRKAVAS